jgi:signal transduction histidine kinase/putative methionine-R-sulfoxide reductase with GAF domain
MPSEVSTVGGDQSADELRRELAEAREQQAATSEILRVISGSPTDSQPVFDMIAESAARLCKAQLHVFRFDGKLIHFAASFGLIPEGVEAIRSAYPIAPGRASIAARSILSGSVEEIPDVAGDDPDYRHLHIARALGYRSIVGVPMLKNGCPIGAIVMGRSQTGCFPKQQIELLRTFADQAVIAIENTRLFEAEQAGKRELQESLDYQTAAAEVLDVISRSPTNSQPVLDTIAISVRRLTNCTQSAVFLYDGQQIHLASQAGMDAAAVQALAQSFPQVPGRGGATARAILTRQVSYIPDVLADNEYRVADVAKAVGYRSIVSVPMVREDHPVGAITATAANPAEFSPRQITLLQTFANQAVIAINNAGLFEEVQARNRDLAALVEVGRAVSSKLDPRVVHRTIVERAASLSNIAQCAIFYYRQGLGTFELAETTGIHDELVAQLSKLVIGTQTGLTEAITRREPVHIPDVNTRPRNPLRDTAINAGMLSALIVPLLGSEGPLGALVLQRRERGEFPPTVISLMQAFADQSAIAIENARLFEEITRKSQELEIAGQHKSQFVANMSHELRTPLAAMLGYAELLQEGIYGALPEKSLPILMRVRSNGKHLLGLINTVLDISKIEAGQFKLNLGEYALGSIVETVMGATESLAATKKLSFKAEVAKGLPYGVGDEQRLTQVLLNLVGNAIKFTDAGEVRIVAGAVHCHFTLSVTDTGPGIPAEECERIFEKFRQVDSSNTRAKGGTGLGLAIAREIVEMHGGRIWVESTLWQGSTFRMELPMRAASAAGAA